LFACWALFRLPEREEDVIVPPHGFMFQMPLAVGARFNSFPG